MKKLILILLLAASPAFAGTATINTDAATDTRLQAWCFAVGAGLGVWVSGAGPANAGATSAAQVKSCIVATITQAVQNVETNASKAAVAPSAISQMN